MAVRSGINNQISYAVETTPGVPTVAGMAFIPLMEGDSLAASRERIEAEGIIPGKRVLTPGMRNGGPITVGGDTSHELYNRGLQPLLTAWFGDPAVTDLGSGRYQRVWTPNEPRALTIQKGVVSLDQGVVEPFTFPGSMAESWELSCSAGEIATVSTTWHSMRQYDYRAVTDGATTNASPTVTSATAEFEFEDIGKAIVGAGIPANTTIIGVTSATTATMSANATATATGVALTFGVPLATANYPVGLKPFKYTHGAVTIDGDPVQVRQLTVSGDNALNTDRRFIGTPWAEQALESGLHVYEGSFEGEFRSTAQYRRFITGDAHPTTVAFANLSGDSLTIDMLASYDPETPSGNGRDVTTLNLPFKCVGDTDADAITVTLVNGDAP